MAKTRDNRTREQKKKKAPAKKPIVVKEREVYVRKPDPPPAS